MNLLKYRVAQVVSAANFAPRRDKQNLRRVLMYHSVVNDEDLASQKSDIYSISETYFSGHIDFLVQNYNSDARKVVSLEDSFSSGVSITFD
ncbi:MAG: hypothetical protein RJA79_885, partial [Actinomycetota bacterium]